MTLEDKPSYNGTTFGLDEMEDYKEGAIALEVKDCCHSIHKLQEPVLYKLTNSLRDSPQKPVQDCVVVNVRRARTCPKREQRWHHHGGESKV